MHDKNTIGSKNADKFLHEYPVKQQDLISG